MSAVLARASERARGPWRSGEVYLNGDTVTLGAATYINPLGWHRSTTFAADAARGYWRLKSGTPGLSTLERSTADQLAQALANNAALTGKVASLENAVNAAGHHSHPAQAAIDALTQADVDKLKAFDAAELAAVTASAQANATEIAGNATEVAANLARITADEALITALQTADAHHGLTNNPHSVTLAQVGAAAAGHGHTAAEVGAATPAAITTAIAALSIPSMTDVTANTAARHAAASVASPAALGLTLAGQALTLNPFTARNYREWHTSQEVHASTAGTTHATYVYDALTAGTYKPRCGFMWHASRTNSSCAASVRLVSPATTLGAWRVESKDAEATHNDSAVLSIKELPLTAGQHTFIFVMANEKSDQTFTANDIIFSIERVR